jgi:hypothetical protein
MARNFCCYVEICRLVLHAGDSGGIFRLEMENDIDVRTFTENTQMECTFHRGFYTIGRNAAGNMAD